MEVELRAQMVHRGQVVERVLRAEVEPRVLRELRGQMVLRVEMERVGVVEYRGLMVQREVRVAVGHRVPVV